MNKNIFLPNYTVGTKAYDEVAGICGKYGSKAVVIGGHRAMAAARDRLFYAVGGKITVTDWLWYGGESDYDNVEELSRNTAVSEADMIWAVGGGKATDTAKALANTVGKPVFTFPTIASNCSACTNVSIMYNKDGTFLKPFFFEKPPVHAFIDTQIIADSPARYMWAGMGDTYAKYFESTVSSRDEDVPHYVAQGVANASMCYSQLMKYGKKAYEDMQKGIASTEFEQAVLTIIVSTAMASIFLCTDHIIDYNTGLAHAIFYALTSYPHIEKNHLHGEVVGYGVLVLLLVDGNEEDFKKVYDFNRSVGLPTKLSDIELTQDELPRLVKLALAMKDIDHNPYRITEDMLMSAFVKLEEINQ